MHYKSQSDFFPPNFPNSSHLFSFKDCLSLRQGTKIYNWNLGTNIFVSRNLGEREICNSSEGLAARFNFLKKNNGQCLKWVIFLSWKWSYKKNCIILAPRCRQHTAQGWSRNLVVVQPSGPICLLWTDKCQRKKLDNICV